MGSGLWTGCESGSPVCLCGGARLGHRNGLGIFTCWHPVLLRVSSRKGAFSNQPVLVAAACMRPIPAPAGASWDGPGLSMQT